jgi:phospholipase C
VTADGHVFADPAPGGDVCADGAGISVQDPANQTIGDLLSAHGVSWGWFQGGFADCSATHTSVGGVETPDYVAHHNPFQYYPSSANLAHTPPASVDEIGHAGPANHQYDVEGFWAATEAGSLPAVSFLKAPAYQDGHAGYSSPLDEQRFLVETLNRLQLIEEWSSTAVIVAYDDSGGWYDRAYGPVLSTDQGRVGLGPRLPFIVISPFARVGLVDHTLIQQSSITRFIEDNWMLGRLGHESTDERAGSIGSLFDFSRSAANSEPLILDPVSGKVVG